MNRSERFYQIDQLLSVRKVMTRQDLLDALQVSWATLKRDLSYLRDRFNAPIVFDRDAGGYRFETPGVGPAYELPGLWFNGDEAYALLTMHQLLCELEPGLLAPHVAPLLSRLESILGREKLHFAQIADRVQIARIGKRRKSPANFGVISRAVLEGLQLQVQHYSRENDSHTERTLSPQRITFYRNNWYLEAWCHSKNSLRRFSVDALEKVSLLNTPAKGRHRISMVKDVRIFVNTIDHAIRLMTDNGVPATAHREEKDGYIEYTVRIPTTAAER